MGRKPNQQQQEVIDFVQRGKGNCMVQAPPGSGKTFVLINGAVYVLTSGIMTTFSAATKDELKERMDSFRVETGQRLRMTAQTLHSMGLTILRQGLGITRDHVNNHKYNEMAFAAIGKQIDRVDPTFHRSVVQLINMKRQTAPFEDYTDEVMRKIVLDYGIPIPTMGELWQIAMEVVPQVITQGFENLKSGHPALMKIDFTDMLYVPFALGLDFKTTEYLFVDESQDLNALQMAFIQQVAVGRSLFVGDRNQAIFHFMGSAPGSIDLLTEQFGAITKSIPVSYRCPTSVCDLASTIFPGMIAAPGAMTGDVHENVGEEELLPLAQTCQLNEMSMMVLCRVRAPLVEQCLDLIRKGVQARVRGKDLGSEVNSIITALTRRPHFQFESMMELLVEYENVQCEAIHKAAGNKDVSKAINDIQDKCSTLRALYHGYHSTVIGQKSLHQFKEYISTLFVDDGSKGKFPILFMTGHGSKGLEADVVAILEPNLLPHPMATSKEDMLAEQCLYYVMATRAKQLLVFIGGGRPDPSAFGHSSLSTLLALQLPEPSRLFTHESGYPPAGVPTLLINDDDEEEEIEHPF